MSCRLTVVRSRLSVDSKSAEKISRRFAYLEMTGLLAVNSSRLSVDRMSGKKITCRYASLEMTRMLSVFCWRLKVFRCRLTVYSRQT